MPGEASPGAGGKPEADAFVGTAEEAVGSLLDRAGLWPLLAVPGRTTPDILVLVDLGASGPVPAAAVEAFIDILVAHAPDARVRVAASADSSTLIAGNRDVYALADLAGYRYRTDGGQDYDIVDLAEEQRDGCFPQGSVLAGTPASAAWIDADVRILFGRFALAGPDGFAGALDTLIGALPRSDKDLHYRLRRDAGEVAAAILSTMPPHVSLMEWLPADSRGGFRVAGRSAAVVDLAGALKLGLDPLDLPAIARVAALHPGAAAARLDGDLSEVRSADALAFRRAASPGSEPIARLAAGLGRPIDPESFPPLRPLDAQLAKLLGERGGAIGGGVRPAVGWLTGAAASAAEAWQTLFAKDSLVRRTVTLDIDPAAVPAAAFDDMVAELDALAPIAASAPERAPGLRWRRWARAVLFDYRATLAIPFDLFVAKVDVSRAIGFMNDYLGGVIVPVAHDALGRPVRQVERNLYLPQPNYLALYGGKPIDVSKIEVARYGEDEHRLYWKTLHSANGSAEADDGYVAFSRTAAGTEVTIVGKQLFTLPPVWQLFDLSRLPMVEAPLTTLAYRSFFERTISNFEALVEGREVRLGRSEAEDSAYPSAAIEATAARLMEQAAPLLARFKPAAPSRGAADADGFVHVAPAG